MAFLAHPEIGWRVVYFDDRLEACYQHPKPWRRCRNAVIIDIHSIDHVTLQLCDLKGDLDNGLRPGDHVAIIRANGLFKNVPRHEGHPRSGTWMANPAEIVLAARVERAARMVAAH